MKKGFTAMGAIFIVIALMILLLIGILSVGVWKEVHREKTPCELEAGIYGASCCETCKSFGYSYLHHNYDSGIFKEEVDDCFCKKGNESIQIY